MEDYPIPHASLIGLTMRFSLVMSTLLVVMPLLANCSARRSEPLVGVLPVLSPQVAQGQKIFMAQCHQCHPGGEAGLGPAINNKPLPAFAIRFQVRYGWGAMPAFSQDQISDVELDAVVAYLRALRAHG
jgi:mono/diheme cytochrome c family protein